MPTQPSDANPPLRQFGGVDRRSLVPLLTAGAILAMLAGNGEAQQVPIPQTAAEVPGRSADESLCADGGPHGLLLGVAAGLRLQPAHYALEGARTDTAERCLAPCADERRHDADRLHQLPPSGISATRTRMLCTVWVISLSKQEPVVVQVPDLGDRFWTLPVYDARTDQISELGLQYGTKPGFYMIVGPNWKGATPPGIAGVVRSSTNFGIAMPRIFMNDTPEDHAAIQPALSQIQFYPLSKFDGQMKTKDWDKIPKIYRKGGPEPSIRPPSRRGLIRRISSTNCRPSCSRCRRCPEKKRSISRSAACSMRRRKTRK